MPFNSSQFAIFLAITWVAWLVIPARARWVVLLSASAYFCAAAHPSYLAVVVGAALLTFVVARKLGSIPEASRRKPLLATAIVLLVANLALFKYSPQLGLNLLLPLGISFYTFQLIGYLVDVQRGAPAERDPRTFALFVLLFPKMVSGPIERARNLLPQLRTTQHFSYADSVEGLRLILWGLFKKLVVADRIAPFVAHVYDNPGAATGPVTAFATVLYAFQLYCDFSGYTDIAIGAGRLFGYKLAPNFNRPYAATSIQDFWKRWHISLTSWLTDYVYTPMTRQKVLKIKLYHMMLGALFVTFIVSGIWHGSHWNFVLWGALHGTYIVASLMSQKMRARISESVGLSRHPGLRHAWRVSVTFGLVCLAYVLFRAGSLADAGMLYASLFDGWPAAVHSVKEFIRIDQGSMLLGVAAIAVVMLVEALGARPAGRIAFENAPLLRRAGYLACAFAVLACGVMGQGPQDFIYFRF